MQRNDLSQFRSHETFARKWNAPHGAPGPMNGRAGQGTKSHESENNLIRERVVPLPFRGGFRLFSKLTVAHKTRYTVGTKRSTSPKRRSQNAGGILMARKQKGRRARRVLSQSANKRARDKQFLLAAHANTRPLHAPLPRYNLCRSFRRGWQRTVCLPIQNFSRRLVSRPRLWRSSSRFHVTTTWARCRNGVTRWSTRSAEAC